MSLFPRSAPYAATEPGRQDQKEDKMARRLSFQEFSHAIENHTLPLDKLADYVRFDPTSAVPRLVFRSDVLLDTPPPTYDVDKAIYQMLRALQDEHRAQLESFSYVGKKSVVAEGDSWFNLPKRVRPPAIADWIELNGRFLTRNIAYWGHTLKKILKEREYIKVLEKDEPDYFMFTAGGNDLQEGLEAGEYIHSYEPSRPPDEYLTEKGQKALAQIDQSYRLLFDEVSMLYPSLVTICHGYDYPRPLVGNGTYIGQFLRRQGIPDDLMTPIMVAVLDKLNSVIEKVSQSYARIHYLDCRRATEPYTWYDDMHPDSDGFKALAAKFEEDMSRA